MALVDTLVVRASEGNHVFLASAAAFLAAGYALCTAIYRVFLHPVASVPGPKYMALSDVPFNLRVFVTFDMRPRVVELHRKYGPIVRVGPNRVMVEGSVAWPQVYGVRGSSDGSSEFIKVPGYFHANDPMGLLGADNKNHRRQRRQVNHAFSAAALAEHENIITQYIDKLMAKFKECAARGEAIDVAAWLNYCAFDIIGDLCFAESFHGLDGDTTFVDNSFIGLEGNSFSRFLRQHPWLKVPLMLIKGTKRVEVARAAGLSNSTHGAKMMRARVAQGTMEDHRRDFATYILRKDKDGQPVLSDQEVLTISSILVNAGSETTATALAGFVFFICRPENADKLAILVDEVCSAFTNEEDINMTSTGQLQYLRAVLDESMRLYPPAIMLQPRISPGAEVEGHWLPQGTVIHTFNTATFRNPNSFRDPDSFHPERWLSSSHPLYEPRFDSDKKEVFRPFSFGARDCVGKNLAHAEMRLIASRFIFNFKFELLPGQEDWMSSQRSTILWLKPGLQVRPSLRKH